MLGLNEGALSSLVLGSVISAVVSWVIAALYFRKTSRAELIADQIRYGLQRALLPILYPQYFNPETTLVTSPEQAAPKNTDVPYVESARFRDKTVRPGQQVSVLIKVRDTGFDLENPAGIKIRDHRENALGIVPLGLGYIETTFHTSQADVPGTYKLTVVLQDEGKHSKSKPNQNVQNLSFVIVQGGKEDERPRSRTQRIRSAAR